MRALHAIVFDFDGVIADCRQSILLPGAAAFLRRAAAVVPIAIASGAVTREIDDILERHALRAIFSAVVGADRTLRSKPSPDPYLDAMRGLERAGHLVDPRRSVAIDDSVWGLVAARTACLRCVGVGCGRKADELAAHAELVVSGLDTLTLDTLDTLVVCPR
jgi:beta-phosphoglucomutase-like phosphatase (HAD superfamily)